MNEEYKKLSELPQAVTPKNCEAYGIENGRSVRVPLIFPTLTEVKNEVTKETTRATNVENALSASIQKNASNITTEKSRAVEAEQKLQQSITDEITRAQNAESALQKNIDTEKTRATQAENSLAQSIEAVAESALEFFATKEQLTAENERATQAEQTLTENLNKEVTERQNAITNVTNSLNTEITNREKDETNIKNTTSKMVFTTDSNANEFFKEIYIYPWQDNNIKKIAIDRAVLTEAGTYKWQITFITNDDKYSYVYLGNKSSIVEAAEYIKGEISGNDGAYGVGATFYAVVDWNKIPNNQTTTFNANLTLRALNSKFSPIITHVLQSYDIVKGSLGNAFFKELYLENLRQEEWEGSKLKGLHAIPYNEIEKRLSINGITRNVDGKWKITFAVWHDGVVHGFLKSFDQSPENDEVLVAELLSWIGDGSIRYTAKMYAVVDWNLIPDGTTLSYARPLLPHILDKRFSPVIYSYIENEKLRKQIEQLTANINTTSEQE